MTPSRSAASPRRSTPPASAAPEAHGPFQGTVSAVTGFGIFVTLDEVYVEGLVHVSELGNDYFHFDPARHLLRGARTRKRYRLGDRVNVKLVRVDLEQMHIDFVLDE